MQRETHEPLEIEDDIPPPVGHALLGQSKYPLKGMKIGQSFFIKTTNPGSARNTVKKAAAAQKITIDARAGTKLINGTEVKGLRVWRIADRFAPEDLKPGRGSKK